MRINASVGRGVLKGGYTMRKLNRFGHEIILVLGFLLASPCAPASEISRKQLEELRSAGGEFLEISLLNNCAHAICALSWSLGPECLEEAIPPNQIQSLSRALIPVLPSASDWLRRMAATRPRGTKGMLHLRVETDGSWLLTTELVTPSRSLGQIPGLLCSESTYPFPSPGWMTLEWGGSKQANFVTNSQLGFHTGWEERMIRRLRMQTCQAEREAKGTLEFTTPQCP